MFAVALVFPSMCASCDLDQGRTGLCVPGMSGIFLPATCCCMSRDGLVRRLRYTSWKQTIQAVKSMSVTKEAVLDRLKTVNGPDFTGNIVDLGLVSDIFIAD